MEGVSPGGKRKWIPDLNDQNEVGTKVSPAEQGGGGTAEVRESEGQTSPVELEPRPSNSSSPLGATPPSAKDPEASSAKPQRKRKRRLVPRSAWAKDLMSAAAEKNNTFGAGHVHPNPKT